MLKLDQQYRWGPVCKQHPTQLEEVRPLTLAVAPQEAQGSLAPWCGGRGLPERAQTVRNEE